MDAEGRGYKRQTKTIRVTSIEIHCCAPKDAAAGEVPHFLRGGSYSSPLVNMRSLTLSRPLPGQGLSELRLSGG